MCRTIEGRLGRAAAGAAAGAVALAALSGIAAAQAVVTPTTIGFGDIRVGRSVAVPVTVTNIGTTPLSGFAGGGISGAFGAVQNCAGGVPVGGTCAFTYSFTPTADGPVNGSTAFSLTSGAGTQNIPITLSGNGVGALADVSPVGVDFGQVNLGDTATVPVTVDDSSALPLGGFAGGGIAAPFGAFQNCAGGVPPGASCAFTYNFTPSIAGAASGSTSFSFNVSNGASQSVPVAVSGTGVAPLAQVSPVTIGFGDVPIGQTVSVPVTVTNRSPQTLTGFAGGGISGAFGASQNCAGGVAPGASCAFIYTFTPSVTTAVSGSTSFSFDVASGATQSVPISLSGTGMGGGRIALVTPTTINFGSIRLGRTTALQVTVRNMSTTALGGFAGGGIGPPFNAVQDCAGGVPVGGTCAFTYSFAPTTTGPMSGNTSFSFNNGTQSLNVPIALSGTGAGVPADVTPTSVDFGLVNVGHTVSVPVTVRNTSPQPLGSFAGGGIGGVFNASQDCAGGVAPGASCTFTYSFTPTTATSSTGDTSFTFSAGGAGQAVPIHLSGQGTGTLAQVWPPTIGFGSIPIGRTVSVPITVANTSPQPLTGFAGGGISGAFGASQNCAGGVPVGGSCVFIYTFTPTTTGPVSGTTAFNFSGAGGAAQAVLVSLSGTGLPRPAVVPAVGAPALALLAILLLGAGALVLARPRARARHRQG
jgi:hypothetical protein